MLGGNAVWRVLAVSLGFFWIFDGLLQFQPQMFGQYFISDVLAPNLSDQPAWMQQIINAGIHLWSVNPPVADVAAALLQVGIGVLLLFPLAGRAFKIGAWVSIVWGIVVWFCGEGAGLFLTGVASLYTGAPGAVLLYVLIAALLLFYKKVDLGWLPKIAGWIFIGAAALQVQPVFFTLDGAQGAAMAAMMETVGVLKTFPVYLSNIIGINPVAANIILILIPLAIGAALLLKPNRATGMVALVFLFLVWWVGQDFGMLSTVPWGTATDPQAAPLLGLFLVPLLVPLYGLNTGKSDEYHLAVGADAHRRAPGTGAA
jgi:hypothetical protein